MYLVENEEKKKQKLKQRGITLIELLVALTILAFISAVVVINVLPERDKAAGRLPQKPAAGPMGFALSVSLSRSKRSPV